MAASENTEKTKKERETALFQGKNIHSSPVDGKLLCSFSEKTCMQRRLNNYGFCIRHVLEDKNAPFKQCKFVAKYNGQRCTNAIPVREERIYCNSHLQVLGIVPKKSRKKKIHEPNKQTTKNIAKSSEAEILPSRTLHQNAVTKRTEKASHLGCAGPSKHSPDERASKKAKILSSNPLLWQLVSTYSQASSHRRDLLPYYGFCSSDEESLYEEESDDECKVEMTSLGSSAAVFDSERTNCENLKCSPRTAKLRQLRESLRAELIGVKKSISAHNKDVKQSSKALGLLMTSVKASPALTVVAIQNENNTFLTSSRKRSAPTKPKQIQCTAKNSEKIKCGRNAIPYTKYCSHHIVNDSKQLLFHKCVADVSANSKCSVPTLDLLYEKPLCRDHAPGKATYHPVLPPVQPPKPVDPLPSQKPLAKKPRRKPQVRASPTQKPVKTSKKATKKEPQKTTKSEKNKRPVNAVPVPVKVKQEILLDHSMNHLNFDKSGFLSPNLVSERQLSVDYIPNGNIKLEQLPSPKNDMNVFGNDEFKTPGMFDAHEMDVDEGLENEDLNMPEDLGDISPTGMLRDSVLKLPLEMSEPRAKPRLKEERKSPIESYSMNPVSEVNLHKPMVLSNRVEKPRKGSLCTNNKQYEVQALANHMNIMPGVRPSRSSVITLPKYPSNSTSLGSGLPRHSMPVSGAEFTSFTPIGAGIVKSEGGARKTEHRGLDVHHGQAMFPLSFDAVLNSSVAWGAGGKLLLNNRGRPLLLNSQMNNATFSPPSLSPHVSPQITLGTAFNFDRPSVLQHSNSSSPTLSPFSANLPNSPHGKLAPRTLRLESRGNPNAGDMDPFFGASFDKP